MLARIALCLLLALVTAPGALAQTTTAGPAARSWSRAAAERWLARADGLARRGETAAAIASYTEALRTDPTLGAAYLGLAQLRLLFGDQRETEWLLTRAIALPDVRGEALARRARLHRAQGRDALALADLQAAAKAEPSPARQRELAAFYVERRAWVAALAVWRRLRASLPEDVVASEREDIAETITALELLAAETDAAQHDTGERGWVLRALRRHADRRRAIRGR